jgi:hypothetical protein
MPSHSTKKARSSRVRARAYRRPDYCKLLNRAVKVRTHEVLMHIVVHAIENKFGLSRKRQQLLLETFGGMIQVYTIAAELMNEKEKEEREKERE